MKQGSMWAPVLGVCVWSSSGLAQGCDWQPLDTGVRPAANACAVLANGDVVYGGVMTVAGPVEVEHVAQWDGVAWHAMGTGLDNFVRALLAMPDGSVIAGGFFQNAGNQHVGLVARWDGSGWRRLGGGLDAGTCQALAITSEGDVIAGGSFVIADGQPAWGVARWDGSSWTRVGGTTDGGGVSGHFKGNQVTRVNAVAVLPNDDIVVTGNFLLADDVPASGIARFDGKRWWPMGGGLSGIGNAICVLPNGDVIVGGVFGQAGGVNVRGLARWDGAEWHALGTDLEGDNGVSIYALHTRAQGDVIVGGAFTEAGGNSANNVALWDPATGTWSAMGSGMRRAIQTTVFDLDSDPRGVVYAAGQFADAGGSSLAVNAAKFDCLVSCYADCDGDGTVNTQDFLCYLNLFTSNDAAADCDGNGTVNTQDFLCYLNAWSSGC